MTWFSNVGQKSSEKDILLNLTQYITTNYREADLSSKCSVKVSKYQSVKVSMCQRVNVSKCRHAKYSQAKEPLKLLLLN